MYSIHGARTQAACWLLAKDAVHQVSPERERIERKKGSIWSPGPRGLFLITKGKEREEDKGGTTGRAAHICSPRMSGAQPLLGAEGRPGGPVVGSSQPPCTPPGRETAQAARVAVVPHCVLLDHLHEVPPAAGISVETGDRWARVGARVTRGWMGRANGRGVMDPRRTLRGLRSVPLLHLQWVLQSPPLPGRPPTHKLPRNPLRPQGYIAAHPLLPPHPTPVLLG